MEQRIELTAERKELFSLSHGVCLTAKVYGMLTREKFTLAFRKVLKRYPVLNSRIDFSKEGTRTLVAVEDKEIEPLYYPYGEVNYIEKQIEKEERIPFQLETGPLFKAVVFKGEERSVVLLFASTLIMDLLSMKMVVEELVKQLNDGESKEEEKPIPMVSLKEGLMGDKRLKLMQNMKVNHLNRGWKKEGHEFTKEEYLYHYGVYHKMHKTPVVLKEIHHRSTNSLLANCEEKNVSVEAALLTAFLAAMNGVDRGHAGKEIPIHYSINLREELILPVTNVIGKLDTMTVLKRQYETGKNFWDNVQEMESYLRGCLKNKQQRLRNLMLSMKCDGGLLEGLEMQLYGGYSYEQIEKTLELFEEGRKGRGIGLYSIREVQYEKEQEFYIDSMNMIPPANLFDDLTIGAIIVNGHLRLSIRYDKNHYSERMVEDMIQTAVNYMWNRSEHHQTKKILTRKWV